MRIRARPLGEPDAKLWPDSGRLAWHQRERRDHHAICRAQA
ncbi:hypothetical protein XOC_0917 [Xanthomonas oryzae pv. oryzicola BLS256]|uniref:Uncharacterized protein n=1 Tax=Xanthomonas oryzae pv. oryzicola (strain BLS256) TaxID=383407 RepID=G7TDY3_XANOB|nr:hypothetical protein XOC_0917 [Xanthomonas oryzae pv. oryzicola BLS256]